METELRDKLKDQARDLLARMDSGYEAPPALQNLIQKLVSQLEGYTGKSSLAISLRN